MQCKRSFVRSFKHNALHMLWIMRWRVLWLMDWLLLNLFLFVCSFFELSEGAFIGLRSKAVALLPTAADPFHRECSLLAEKNKNWNTGDLKKHTTELIERFLSFILFNFLKSQTQLIMKLRNYGVYAVVKQTVKTPRVMCHYQLQISSNTTPLLLQANWMRS